MFFSECCESVIYVRLISQCSDGIKTNRYLLLIPSRWKIVNNRQRDKREREMYLIALENGSSRTIVKRSQVACSHNEYHSET